MTAGRFHYSLEALLKYRKAQQDGCAAQELAARGVMGTRAEQARAASATVAGTEQALRDALRDGASIDARLHQSRLLYLAQANAALRTQARALSKAEEAHEQARRALLHAVQAVRALERHKEGRAREHALEMQQLAQGKQDDLWLTRRRTSWR